MSSASTAPGEGTLTAYSRKSGMRRSCRRMPPLACGLAPMRRVPLGASSASSARSFPRFVEEFLGLVAFHPGFKLFEMLRDWFAGSVSGT